jgi:hypothetical protein
LVLRTVNQTLNSSKARLTLTLITPTRKSSTPHGCRQATNVNRIFKIEIGRGFPFDNHLCQRGLATLAGAKEGSDWMDPQCLKNPIQRMGTLDHNPYYILENRNVK